MVPFCVNNDLTAQNRSTRFIRDSRKFHRWCGSRAELLGALYQTPLDTTPGSRVVYSDLGFIALGEVVTAVAGEPLYAAVGRLVTGPLGLDCTDFLGLGERPVADQDLTVPDQHRLGLVGGTQPVAVQPDAARDHVVEPRKAAAVRRVGGFRGIRRLVVREAGRVNADQHHVRANLAVADGQAVYGAAIALRITELFGAGRPAAPFPDLTPREREVLNLLADGARNSEIARQLGMTDKTVRNHVSAILMKLQVTDRTAAAIKARDAR